MDDGVVLDANVSDEPDALGKLINGVGSNECEDELDPAGLDLSGIETAPIERLLNSLRAEVLSE
jgi:hypothetical protein